MNIWFNRGPRRGNRGYCSRSVFALYDTIESVCKLHRNPHQGFKTGASARLCTPFSEILANMWILLQSIKGLTNPLRLHIRKSFSRRERLMQCRKQLQYTPAWWLLQVEMV